MQKIDLEGQHLFGEQVPADVAEKVPPVVVVVVSHYVATLWTLSWAMVQFVATGAELEGILEGRK